MLQKLSLVLFVALISATSWSQNTPSKFALNAALRIPDSLTHSTSDISRYINEHYSSDSDRVHAAFAWVAYNISYDVQQMFALNFEPDKNVTIAKALATKSAICEGYAELFSDLCRKSNVQSIVVEGYTKQRGMVDYMPHAWVAAKLYGSWFLFDPTWSSGFLEGGKFVPMFSHQYYTIAPASLLKTHRPFDKMYQFIDYPITAQEFFDGKSVAANRTAVFAYEDTLSAFQQLPEIERWAAIARRIEQNGVKSTMILQMLQFARNKQEQIKVTEENKKVEKSQQASVKINAAVNAFNEYVAFKNKQFSPKRSDEEISHLLDKAEADIDKAKQLCENLTFITAENNQLQAELVTHMNALAKNIEDEKQFIKKYLKTGKLMRPLLFRAKT